MRKPRFRERSEVPEIRARRWQKKDWNPSTL
jgi:hypothetical protein